MLALLSEVDVLHRLAAAVHERRIALRWRQEDLATRSGVSIATLRRFERSGSIASGGLAKLLVSLGLAERMLEALTTAESSAPSIAAFLEGGTTTTTRRRVRLARST